MALVNCPDCTKEISSKAQSCPNCGAPGPIAFVQEFNRLVELESAAQNVSIPRAKEPNKPIAARTQIPSSEENAGSANGAKAGVSANKLEARIARLESDVENIHRDVGEIMSDIKDLQIDSRTYFRIVWGGLIVFGLGLAGLMAKGFGWI